MTLLIDWQLLRLRGGAKKRKKKVYTKPKKIKHKHKKVKLAVLHYYKVCVNVYVYVCMCVCVYVHMPDRSVASLPRKHRRCGCDRAQLLIVVGPLTVCLSCACPCVLAQVDDSGKITRLRKDCPHPICGAGKFRWHSLPPELKRRTGEEESAEVLDCIHRRTPILTRMLVCVMLLRSSQRCLCL
jgi:hypothetical protein